MSIHPIIKANYPKLLQTVNDLCKKKRTHADNNGVPVTLYIFFIKQNN